MSGEVTAKQWTVLQWLAGREPRLASEFGEGVEVLRELADLGYLLRFRFEDGDRYSLSNLGQRLVS